MTRLILELTRPYRWIIAIVLAAMLVQTAMSLAAPWPLKIILDNVLVVKHPLPHWMTALLPALGGKNEIDIVGLAAIFFVLIAVVSAVASYIANYYTETVGQWVAYDLRTRTYHHLQRLSLSYYDCHQVGAIVSTINDDVDTVQNSPPVLPSAANSSARRSLRMMPSAECRFRPAMLLSSLPARHRATGL